MKDEQMKDFVEKYQTAWSLKTPNIMKNFWHDDGVLYHPILSEPIPGSLVPANNNRTKSVIPGFKWTLIRWASAHEDLFIEWKTEAIIAGKPYAWTGVDRMQVVNGKIKEEIVYFDTFPLRAMRDSNIPYEPMVDVKELDKFIVD